MTFHLAKVVHDLHHQIPSHQEIRFRLAKPSSIPDRSSIRFFTSAAVEITGWLNHTRRCCSGFLPVSRIPEANANAKISIVFYIDFG
jgi:hypothetical protein